MRARALRQPSSTARSDDTPTRASTRGRPAESFDHRPEAVAQRERQAMVDRSPQVQRAAVRQSKADASAVQRAARSGIQGVGGRLPHLEAIQRSFGHYDVSHVRAHTGSAATAACRAMGAQGYATGNEVAFAGAPSLHTAAHEAAHTVQQRAGVQLRGGVGQAGDRYERHADAVARAVVQGRSAEALLDAHVGGAGAQPARPGGTAPVQGQLSFLGWMNDEPDGVTASNLSAKLESPLPTAFARFLPALESSSTEYIFAADESGKVSLDEAKDVIANAKDSFVVSGQSVSFVLPADGWQHMEHAEDNAATELVRYKERWLLTMDLKYLPQMTPKVLTALGKLDIDERTPPATMVLPTGLTYESIVRKHFQVEEYGILGDVVVSVTPSTRDSGSSTTVQSLKKWIIDEFKAWEPMQMDPRHIGTHDGYDMGGVWHYHLVMPPNTTLASEDKDLIDEKMRAIGAFDKSEKLKEEERKRRARRKKKKEKNPEEVEMRAFLGAKGVSTADGKKQAQIRRKLISGVDKALVLWKQLKDGLDWTPT